MTDNERNTVYLRAFIAWFKFSEYSTVWHVDTGHTMHSVTVHCKDDKYYVLWLYDMNKNKVDIGTMV